jgi:asparagine synthase (glutamine-hydrolysing)
MCGIFGVIGAASLDGLSSAAKTLDHRGPDAFGQWNSQDRSVYLAHCRLAIIDLSPAGIQPMGNENSQVQIVFNGEIYNFKEIRDELVAAGHQFRSHTDTEVIIHGYEQWGVDVLYKLRGIFAFGIWDEQSKRLLIARDRLGVKPLYYSQSQGQLAFASEPRAILSIPGFSRSADSSALVQYLQYSFISGENSAWNDIRKLLPGHYLVHDVLSGTSTVTKYWEEPHRVKPINWSHACEELESLLSESVTEELISDVPVGVFLSGGIDSSLVSAYAVAHSPKIKSFCVDFLGWEKTEAKDAAEVATHLQTSHYSLPLQQSDCHLANPEFSEAFFKTWDEPLADPAIIPTWHLSKLIRQHVTVALSGDGGDELFAGYRWYESVIPTPRRALSWRLEQFKRLLGIGRSFPNACADEHEYYHFLHCPSFSTNELMQLFPCWEKEILSRKPGDLTRNLMQGRTSHEREWQRADLRSYLVDNNLARVDRASMAHGLEVRVPLLDHRISEFAFSLPLDFGSYRGVPKALLKELASRKLPRSILTKPKQGFSFPLESFLSKSDMANSILGGTLVKNSILSKRNLQAWLADQKDHNTSLKLWLLFILEKWSANWWLK